MPSFVLKGSAAVVQWGWHNAAQLGSYTFTASDVGGDVTAMVTSVDAVKLSQPALTFCITRPNGTRWTWPVLSLHIADGTLSASLGPQE